MCENSKNRIQICKVDQEFQNSSFKTFRSTYNLGIIPFEVDLEL